VHGSEMKPPFVLPLANVLSRHKIVGANLEAAEVASHLRDATDIFELMLPKRRIHFDAECISGADDLERVVGHFADATEGTWNLSDLSARLHHDAERGFIDFDTDGRSFHWEFEQSGDYVSQELLDHLQAFAAPIFRAILSRCRLRTSAIAPFTWSGPPPKKCGHCSTRTSRNSPTGPRER
jgi:hypothetical protein